ncbi:hypothetical protein GGI25_003130 [Coemansia spiralis]|uniref:Uncharacterized protein n=2 Tax=Coemansia TaxID=4863 RepID=A0A9W8G964_9FUNG|nr:hypothetical protein BX070DRAFT_255098 [Coemansia spiralis]KAJ1991754.1 hypothetical protein EDC05_003251 [Coemansia umbellata]KAJ2621741.1 hypothetical protein GGI26_003836 [Coemansia sp. RSA 1358]KAJ2677495.1 hypothetical protein GGI25_003130 [Coemansia spiralis]
MTPAEEPILHKILHDRYHSTRSTPEKAVLTLALQCLAELQRRRHETLERIRELSLDIQHSESQLRRLDHRINRCIDLGQFAESDHSLTQAIYAKLQAQETRLRDTKRELIDAEQRLTGIVTVWATHRF